MSPPRARTSIVLTKNPLDVAEILSLLSDPLSGGVSVFIGRVRNDPRPKGAVPATGDTVLQYEAYRPLALRELQKIARSAEERYGARAIVIRHRTGRLRTGEASVIIAVATPHRKEAFAACRFIIDRLKKEVPIWKTFESNRDFRT